MNIHDKLFKAILPQVEAVTAADTLREEGRQERLIEEEMEGQRKVLLLQLRVRFGTLPEAVVAQVSTARTAQLDRWMERAFTARSLDELLGSS